MEQAERASSSPPAAARRPRFDAGLGRGLLAFVSLAYAWVLGWTALSALVLLWVLAGFALGRQQGWAMLWLALACAALLACGLRAIWMGRAPRPHGLRLHPEDAPALFEALARLRRKVHGPAIDEVYVDEEFNASISRVPRWGGFGGHVNRLVIGLPLLMAMDRQRIFAVLAHEYGHLRGGPGRLSSWVYHSRLGWSGFYERLARHESLLARPMLWFFRWYAPRLEASTLALARRDEFVADAIAARILGKEVLAAALVEFSVKAQWLQSQFWPEHWRRALTHAEPEPPMARLRAAALRPVAGALAYRALHSDWGKASAAHDSHPALRERVQALLPTARASLPKWSGTGATDLLGPALDRAIEALDRRWCQAQAENWRRRHAKAAVMLARVQSLRARRRRLQPEEWLEWGQLLEVILPAGRVQALLQTAVAQMPGNADACQALAVVLVESFMRRVDEALARGEAVLVEQAPEWPLIWPLLEQLWLDSLHYRWWAARTAVQIWQTLADEAGRLQVQVQVLKAEEGQASRQPPTVTELQSLEEGSPALHRATEARASWVVRWSDWVHGALGGVPPDGQGLAEPDDPPRVRAVAELLPVSGQLARWRQREKTASEAEARSWQELHALGTNLRQASAASLRASAQQMLRAVLATYPEAQRAWLVRQSLRCMPDRPVHLLFVQFTGVGGGEAQALCESIRGQWPGPGLGFCVPLGDPAKARIAHDIAQAMLYERGMDMTPHMLALCSHLHTGGRPPMTML